jgi:putative hemolysin
VHWSDLLRGEGDAGALAREPLLLPVSLSVSQALHRMTGERQQMAVVIGESGAVDGIVSLEDLLEEVVGEIYDETDADERVPARVGGGALRVPGTYPVHDLDDLGVVLTSPPEGSYVTVAGMVLVVLGHIPEGPGESVDLGGWTATVTEADGRVVGELLLVPAA